MPPGGAGSVPPPSHPGWRVWPPGGAWRLPWGPLTGTPMRGSSSPLKPHAASPAELRDRIEAERRGRPFLVLRGEEGAQRILELDPALDRLSVGRALQNDVDLPWDTEVSRLHAELECIAGEWTVS